MANTTENINYKITVDGDTGTAVVRDLKGQIIATKVPVKQLREEFGNFAKTVNATNFNKFNAGLKTASTANKKMSEASGAATSSVMELSRVVSDAPYGIRGMANNITQLVSQMGFATKKAGGFAGALKEMGKQFMGPLGIVFLITLAVSALDFFYGANKKAEKGVNEFNDSASKSASNLKILKRALEDGTLSTEEANKAVKKANEEYVGLNLQLDNNNKLTEDSVGFIDDKINAIERLAKAQAIQSLLENQYAIIAKAKSDLNAKLAEKGLNLKDLDIRKEEERVALEGKTGVRRRKIVRDFLTQNEKVANGLVTSFREIEKKGNDAITSLMSQLSEADLVDELFKDKKKKGGKPKLLEIKDFDKQVEDYLSQIASVSEKEEILNAKLNSDKILIQEEYHLKNLDIKNEENKAKFKQQSDAYRIEYEAFLNQEVVLGNLTKKEAEVKLNKFDKDAKAQQDKSDANYKILLSKWNTYYSDKLFAALSGEMKVAETEEDANTKRLNAINAFIEQYKVLSSSVSDFLQAESERELTIEQNKTNILNAELNDRLLNESLSADQRASIQNQIAQNDEKLRVRQEAIKRKAFNTQKAFNIAAALVDTYAAASSAYRNTLANPINALDPTAGLLRAKINAGIAMAGGLAQVAAIARQKYQSSSASTPINTGASGGGGGSSRAEPSFNIVGRSQDNILLSAIQSQFDKPLKAYVVARDVTNQQQLDGVISTAAST